MRRLFFGMFAILWVIEISAQDSNDEWERLIIESAIDHNNNKEQIFLIEVPVDEVRSRYKLLRSFDKNHHIVKGRLPGSSRREVWSIDDVWKLNIDSKSPLSHFYIIVSEHFDIKMLSDFEILRSYPVRNTYLVEGRLDLIKRKLLHDPEVFHITNKVYAPKVESRVIDMNLNPNRVNRIHHSFPLLDGSSETISIQENSFDTEDIDLLNRSLPSGLESERVDNHATEMATIIAGAGNSFITGRGVAKNATIISSDFFDAMPDSDQDYLDFGIITQNHSYGILRESEYGVEARAFDQSAFQNKNLLHVFSSGNEGTEISSEGRYSGIEGFANLTGNIKMSKNSLVVGSVDTVGSVPAFVSRGPAYDGRVKPEVVAYSVVGSSNSAALVSGVSSLLQQQYREGKGVDMPSALVKAILINSAEDVGTEGLDFVTGYGNVNAWLSLKTLQNSQTYSGAVGNGEVEQFTLNLPSNAQNLKVTICWTDPPANVSDFTALVNNLDLRLLNGAEQILPWVLDSNPIVSALSKQAVRSIDTLNNVEQITISNPALAYTVEVKGTLVSGSQEFHIAWQYDVEDSFEWDFPTGSDNMPYNGETGSYFRWTTTKAESGTLSYSVDGINWIELDSNVDLTKGYWRWDSPPPIGDVVRARIEVGGEIFETESFTVSTPLSPRVGFNCGDSVMLRWNGTPNAVDYSIFSLGEQTLELYQTTTDTFLVIPNKEAFNARHFAIRPGLSSGKDLLSSPTFDFALQGVECFIFSFFQTVALDTGIYLNLSLGTTYGIDRIEFERNNLDEYVEIRSETSVSKETITFLDDKPNQGYNEHRVTIYFVNGETLTMSAGTSFYLTEEPLRVFPNPVRVGEPLAVLTKLFDDTSPIIELIDSGGALVYRQAIQGTQDFIPTDKLKSGSYFYRFKVDGEIYTGRLLIR